LPTADLLTSPRGGGEDIQRAQSSLVEKGEQDAFAVADLLVEDTAAGAGLARPATSLVGEAFGLGGLPGIHPAGEVMQLGPGEPDQRRVGQPVGDRGPRGAQITVHEGEQGIAGGEPDHGRSRVVAVVFEDLAGLFDQVADAGGGDFQQVGEHVHGADLPLVEQGEQDAGGIVEQGLAAQLAGGLPGAACQRCSAGHCLRTYDSIIIREGAPSFMPSRQDPQISSIARPASSGRLRVTSRRPVDLRLEVERNASGNRTNCCSGSW
jgi:hypothetical protein